MLIIRKEAEEDINETYERYEEKQTNLGVEFVSELESILETIEENPKLYAKAFKNVRRALCKRFPYSVYFTDSGANIVVIGVLHQRRRPSVWQSRT